MLKGIHSISKYFRLRETDFQIFDVQYWNADCPYLVDVFGLKKV